MQIPDLEDLICGLVGPDEEWEDAAFLKSMILPSHGYDQDSAPYKNFITYLTTLKGEERKLFMNFCTGSNRLPAGGFAALEPRMTVGLRDDKNWDNKDHHLPTVSTCQHYVKMPEYSTLEILKAKFETAAKEGR